jgi:hypothetical protein
MRPLQKNTILVSLLAVLVAYPSAQEGVADVVKRTNNKKAKVASRFGNSSRWNEISGDSGNPYSDLEPRLRSS